MNRAACECCFAPCGSAAYICVINEADGEDPTAYTQAAYWICAETEYSTADPPDNTKYIHSLVSMSETGLPEFEDTGYALVGLELLVHLEETHDPPYVPPSPPPVCSSHELQGVEIDLDNVPINADHSAAILEQIHERFGETQGQGTPTPLNPHPQRIYFIIDDSGSYNLEDFIPTYNSIKTHYENAGMSVADIETRFGFRKCATQVAVHKYTDPPDDFTAVITAMYPSENWLPACVTKMKRQVGWTP